MFHKSFISKYSGKCDRKSLVVITIQFSVHLDDNYSQGESNGEWYGYNREYHGRGREFAMVMTENIMGVTESLLWP